MKMSYFKTTVKCCNGMTFITKYSGADRTGGKRAKKSQPTSEQKQRYNIRKTIERLYYTLLCNFYPGDYNVVLTYPKDDRRTVSEAKATVREFLRSYRDYCRERGYRPDYIYNTEIGVRGALHHHIILHSHRDIEDIEDLWRKTSGGSIQHNGNWRLWANYDWQGLAEYLVDRTKSGKLPDTHIPGERRYVPSKGLKKPEVTHERIDAERWYAPKAPKGYELIPDSVYSGKHELTGGSYIKYGIRRLI